jgi:integrase/recombinase XerC
VKQSKPQKLLIPVIRDNDTKKMLDTRKGKGFNQLCDEAIIRLYYNTGTHLSEIGNLQLDDIDLEADSVHYSSGGNPIAGLTVAPVTVAVAYSRLRTSAHWPIDVVAGALWGIVVGVATRRLRYL